MPYPIAYWQVVAHAIICPNITTYNGKGQLRIVCASISSAAGWTRCLTPTVDGLSLFRIGDRQAR